MKGALIGAVLGCLVLGAGVFGAIAARALAAWLGVDPTLAFGGFLMVFGTVGGAVLGYVIRRQ